MSRISNAVKQRLTQEIAYWDRRADDLERRERAGQSPALNSRRARERAEDLTERLRRRLAELDDQRDLTAHAPIVFGGAIVVPQGLIDRLDGIVTSGGPERLAAFETRAIGAVLERERAANRVARDASADRLGYDVVSKDEATGQFRFFAVKPLHQLADRVQLTGSEVVASLNAGDSYWVACVPETDGGQGEPIDVRVPVGQELSFNQPGVAFRVADADRVTTRAEQA